MSPYQAERGANFILMEANQDIPVLVDYCWFECELSLPPTIFF